MENYTMLMPPQSRSRRVIYRKNQFEKEAWSQHKFICGIDEVGRGCLAGPLVAAAVILPLRARHTLIRDSKVLSAQQREKAYAWIIRHSWCGIGIVHNRIVDEHNIWQATLLAMKRALIHTTHNFPFTLHAVVVDAMPLNVEDVGWNDMKIYHFPKGESISLSIAAASIIAKVTRDRIMQRMNRIFPGFCLDEHKGYATTKHRIRIGQQGSSIIHRTTFLGSLRHLKETSHEKQQSLC